MFNFFQFSFKSLCISITLMNALGLIHFTTINSLNACTGIKLTAKDGAVVHGRTLEFGMKVNSSVAVIPRNIEFIGTTPNGQGLKYKSKYGAVGSIAFDNPAIMDGLNEKGLSVGTFYFPGFAGYADINKENQSKALSPIEFPHWILTQFATIDEVKNNLSNVVIAPTVNKEWGSNPPPFHYIVYEKSGKALVIEPREGKLLAYDNPLGTFTNSPGFDWHMENLRNYINLTTINVKPLKVEGLTFSSFGQGSGMVGLPGDFTPPSRFVRAAIFSITAIPSANSNEGIGQVFHILNQFDIPVGVAREVENGIIHSDYTQVTCAHDPQALKYYFKTYDDQTIKFVDLNAFDLNANSIKKMSPSGEQSFVDVSASLK